MVRAGWGREVIEAEVQTHPSAIVVRVDKGLPGGAMECTVLEVLTGGHVVGETLEVAAQPMCEGTSLLEANSYEAEAKDLARRHTVLLGFDEGVEPGVGETAPLPPSTRRTLSPRYVISGAPEGLLPEYRSVTDVHFRMLTGQEIVEAARREAGRPWVGTVGLGEFEREPLWGITAVPGDERLEAWAMEWAASDDAEVRAVGASAMEFLPLTPEREMVLRRLLEDPYLSPPTGLLTPWMKQAYAVRQVAARALAAQGLFPAATLETRAQVYRPVAWGWVLAAGIGAAAAWGLWRWKFRPGRRWGKWVVAGGVLLVVAGSWVRSYRVADDFAVTVGNTLFTCTTWRGAVHVEITTGFPARTGLVHATTTKTLEPSELIFITRDSLVSLFRHRFGAYEEDVARGSWGWLPWVWAPDGLSATLPPSARGVQVTVPHRWVAGGVGMALAVMTGWAWWRSRRRRTRGGCPQCGYDVRVQAAIIGGRCPECGRVVGATG